MPKIDKQSRLTIPYSLIQKVEWQLPKEIALCYNFESATITVCDTNNIVNKNVIAFKKLDCQGRFAIPKEIFSLLKINRGDFLFVYLNNTEIKLKKQ